MELVRDRETVAAPEQRADAELCRLTVVAPRTRMDLALPVDATLADVLPTLLRHAGEDPADPAFLRGGWSLQRLGDPPLDIAMRLSSLGLRDGDTLYLRHRDLALPELAFDDVADAMSTASRREGRHAWTAQTTRVASVVLGCAFAGGAVVAVARLGPPWLVPSAILLTVAALTIGLATACARSFEAPEAGVAVAGVAVVAGFAGGFLLLADHGWASAGAPGLLVGSAVVLVLAILAVLGVGRGRDGFIGVAAAAIVGLAGAGARAVGLGDAASVAAAISVVLLAMTPLLPSAAARIARLPMPVLPLGADDIRHADDVMPGRDVLARARAADRVFTGLTAAVAVSLAVCAAWLAATTGWYGPALTAAIGVALWLRARHLTGRPLRVWLLAGGAVCLGLALCALGSAGTSVALLVPVVLMVAAVVALVWGVRMAGRRLTPYWGRGGDLLEVLVLLSVVPLALGVAGAYTAMQNLFG